MDTISAANSLRSPCSVRQQDHGRQPLPVQLLQEPRAVLPPPDAGRVGPLLSGRQGTGQGRRAEAPRAQRPRQAHRRGDGQHQVSGDEPG